MSHRSWSAPTAWRSPWQSSSNCSKPGFVPRTRRPRSGPARAGGWARWEAPRGTLFHEYAFDEEGRCLEANLVIPTAQNLANLEADLKAYAPGLVDREVSAIEQALKILVRAYDPCISCSTHVIRLDREPSTP